MGALNGTDIFQQLVFQEIKSVFFVQEYNTSCVWNGGWICVRVVLRGLHPR